MLVTYEYGIIRKNCLHFRTPREISKRKIFKFKLFEAIFGPIIYFTTTGLQMVVTFVVPKTGPIQLVLVGLNIDIYSDTSI